jgi:DNA ligase (NAD+)
MSKAKPDQKYLQKLQKLVVYHREKYHTEDAPEISDAAYDALVRELAELEESLGATHRVAEVVGGSTSAAFTKVRHQVPQWSFDNVFDESELSAWEERLLRTLSKEGLSVTDVEYVAEHKIDGLKLVVEYVDGVLTRASTRGDGKVGEDVTHTARTIKSLPKQLTKPVSLICVGEVWLSATDFNKLNEFEVSRGEEPFANPRNAAAGTLRQLDPEVAKARNLSFFSYDIDLFEPHATGVAVPLTQFEELDLLAKLGLPTNAHSKRCKNLKEVEKYYQTWKNKSETLPYGVDGIVIKTNQIRIQKAAGYTAKSPRFGIAYKFPAVETTTVVEAIDLQVGRTGVVTPVAHLRAVVVDGSTVTRATLHNEDQIKRLDVRVGDTIVLRKAGDVIPEVVSVLKELRPKSAKPYVFPSSVAACGGDGSIERIPGEAAYRCVSLDSDFLKRQKMYYFVSKSALNFDGVGPKNIDALLDSELISDVADLFTLKAEEVLTLPGFKQKSAENLIAAITARRTVTLSRLLVGLSIDNVGEETARLLATHFPSIEKLKRATMIQLVAVDGVGETVAQNIIAWQSDVKAQALLEKLLLHLDVQNTDVIPTTGKFVGQSFVFTGTLENLGRSEAAEIVKREGASVSSTVSKKTSYVVVGSDPGSKAAEAEKLGVTILDEAAFLALVAR